MSKKVAIYARVSSDEQKEARTVLNQRDHCRRYCELNEWEVVDEYIDEGYSGAWELTDRPEAARLLQDAHARRFDLVLVYRLDRLARSTRVMLDTFETLSSLGIGLCSATESFETMTASGRFFMTMLASIASLEREVILDRFMAGKKRVAAEGRWLGGHPPYGYDVDEHGFLQINEEEARIVRLIFKMYIEEDKGLIGVAETLNAMGVPSVKVAKSVNEDTDGKWYHGTVALILKNATYKGEHAYRKRKMRKQGRRWLTENYPAEEHIVRQVPAIVSEETWNAAQATLAYNGKNKRWSGKRPYLLKGLVKCGTCGRTLVGAANLPQGRAFYKCPSRPACGGRWINADVVEQAVWADIKAFVQDPGDVLAELEARARQQTAQVAPLEAEAAELERNIAARHGEREKVIGLYKKGLISEAEAQTALEQAAREIELLVKRKEGLFSQQVETLSEKNRALTAQVILKQLAARAEQADFATQRELISSLVDRILIERRPGNRQTAPRITLHFAFRAPQELSPDFQQASSW